MYRTKTLYTVKWDNNEDYEDHATGIWCVCPTEKVARKVMKCLIDQKIRDCQLIEKLEAADSYDLADDIESFWNSRMYYFHLESVTFDVGTIDYIK